MTTEVIVHIDVDEDTSFNLNEVQARELYNKLKTYFGDKWQYIPSFPVYPTYPLFPQVYPAPVYPGITWTSTTTGNQITSGT